MTRPLPQKGKTDVILQDTKLFIEGVQVPYISMSVTNQLGALPSAVITVPPQVGLMDIARYYNPKVHIFFVDPVDGQEKLLFYGFISGANYHKSAAGSGSTGISFSCMHAYAHLSQLLLDYAGWTNELLNPNALNEGAVKQPAMSSDFAIALAMTGIFKDESLKGSSVEVTPESVKNDRKNQTTKTSPAILPESLSDYSSRFEGVPGILLNFWNQMKLNAYWDTDENEMMVKFYIPLVEEGLQLFTRMGGHYSIETKIEEDRVDPCPGVPNPGANNKKRIVPPSLQTFLRSSLETDMGVKLAQQTLQFSGELADLISIWTRFLGVFDYELLFLTSPAEIQSPTEGGLLDPATGDYVTQALDVVVKPQLPFYFSPMCNVLYPGMIESVSISQDEYNIPTRINIRNDELPGVSNVGGTNFRAPASIREAIASFRGTETKSVATVSQNTTLGDPTDVKAARQQLAATKPGTREVVEAPVPSSTTGPVPAGSLATTLAGSHGKLGKYEQGRGVKFEKSIMPRWLAYYASSAASGSKGEDATPEAMAAAQANIAKLSKGWEARYGAENGKLNPWSQDSGLNSYQKLLIASADYSFGMAVARAKSGSVNCIFNPYIVPGYPMDILDDTPNHPSFHAYCTSVTHTFTASSISTSVGFACAMSYTELANYYQPPVHPWMQVALNLAEKQTIIGNEEAKTSADDFYLHTLGIRAASPDQLYNFETGGVKPVMRQGNSGLMVGVTGSVTDANGGETNQMLSAEGNLTLVYRGIESRKKVEERKGVSFIDMTPGNYNPTVIKYTNEILKEKDQMEPGESPFLVYTPFWNETEI